MICLILLVWFRENHIPAKSTKWSARSVCIWSIRHHNKLASGKLALHHWKSNCHRWRFDYFDMCSLSYETYIKWELRCSTVWRKGKGTQKLYVTSQIWDVNEIELVDTTKIMISLCKAKPEWFSPSDIRQVIFADFYEMVWNLHQIRLRSTSILRQRARTNTAKFTETDLASFLSLKNKKCRRDLQHEFCPNKHIS